MRAEIGSNTDAINAQRSPARSWRSAVLVVRVLKAVLRVLRRPQTLVLQSHQRFAQRRPAHAHCSRQVLLKQVFTAVDPVLQHHLLDLAVRLLGERGQPIGVRRAGALGKIDDRGGRSLRHFSPLIAASADACGIGPHIY